MSTGVKDKYNIAINSKGYMLRGAPGQVAYAKSVVPSQIDRLAVSDLAYSDFAGQGLFYLAQTDWNAGIKSERMWRDDAKFYYSTNIDAYSQQGAIKLELELSSNNDFAENILCGCIGSADITDQYVGCEDDGSGNVKIYEYTTVTSAWNDIAGTDFNTSQNLCSGLVPHKGLVYALTVGSGNADVVASWNGSAWTDHSAAIIAAITGANLAAARAFTELAGTLYVGCDKQISADDTYIVSTADNGTTWAEELYLNIEGTIIAMQAFESKCYYLLSTGSLLELYVYDPVGSTNVLVRQFPGTIVTTWGNNDLLTLLGGKLIITVPTDSIYDFDGITINKIFTRDAAKTAIGNLADAYLSKAPVFYNDRLIWGNLVYDGEYFYNWRRPNGDATDKYLYPLFVTSANKLYSLDTTDSSVLWENAATYKTTLANNYLISNEMAPVGAIDKILDSVTIMFEKMATGQSIKVEYSINEMSTWVSIGTRSYSASDSTTIKTWQVPGSINFNKIWFRVSLDGSATSPVLTDLVMAYKPIPDYKNRWDLRLNFSESVKLLNKQNEQRTGQELNSELWNEKATKQRVIFEDVDYLNCNLVSAMAVTATSALVDSTKRFPRQGRIRAVSGSVAEEMTYTSALTNKLLGISRGKRGTTARAYGTAQQLDSGYDVYIENITSYVSFTDENKTEDSAQVLLIES